MGLFERMHLPDKNYPVLCRGPSRVLLGGIPQSSIISPATYMVDGHGGLFSKIAFKLLS
jgi:hypothetical protein